MNNILQFYNLIAEKEASEWYPNNLLLPTIKSFIKLFNFTPKILDLGCGTGHETMRINNEGAYVEGLDFSVESIKIARERNPNIIFHNISYNNINQSIGNFDGIFASASLIHLNEDELINTINIIKRVHNNNGYFLNIFQKGEGKRIHFPEINGIRIERIVERYSADKMVSIFNKCGYHYEKEIGITNDPKDTWKCLIFRKES